MGSKNLTGVQYRKFLGALGLGLPGAGVAHFLTFGSGHVLGGSSHDLVIDGIVAAVCASVVALLAGAVYLAAGRRDGSIVAARLRSFVPGWLAIATASAGWFWLIEHSEPAHPMSLLLAGAAVLLVAALLHVAVSVGLRRLSAVALAFLTLPFAAHEPEGFASLVWVAPTQQRRHLAISRYSRPPPSFP